MLSERKRRVFSGDLYPTYSTSYLKIAKYKAGMNMELPPDSMVETNELERTTMKYPLALREGTILADDYRIEGILGAGGSGITYIAKEISLNREIAIKEYFPSDYAMREGESEVRAKTESDELDYTWGLDRFIEEAQTLAKFDHTNIVRVFRYFQTHNTAYMVLKFEEGQNFKTWLHSLGRPPTQAELDVILTPLLDALELIHRDDFLHRDIAPDNIMIRNNGSPVLIDFGSARRVVSNLPKTVSALIKPGYSPHEQYAMTGKDQGPWTDIYSLAATLYHAVTGKRPLDSLTRMTDDELIPAAKAASQGFRKGFLKAIDHGLKLKPKQRPQSVTKWRAQLFSTSHSPVTKRKKTQPKPTKTVKKKIAKPVVEETVAPPKTPQRTFTQRIARRMRRAFIRFLAEYARPEKNKDLQKVGSLITRLGEMKQEQEKSLEQQLGEMQSQTLQKVKEAKTKAKKKEKEKKPGLIEKMLPKPAEKKAESKPLPAPNKSFEPEETTQTVKAEKTEAPKPIEQPQNLVTVKVKREKIEVEPGPTTQARAKIRDRHKEPPQKEEKKKKKISRFSIALRTIQLLMIIAIVVPMVYFFNIGNDANITPSGNLVRIMKGHTGKVSAVSVSQDGTRIISGSHDNDLIIWDIGTGKKLKQLSAHSRDISALDISGNRIISADTKGELILWDTKTGKPIKNFSGHQTTISSVVFSGSNNNFFSVAGKTIKFWNTSNIRKAVYAFKAHNTPVKVLAYSNRRKILASVGQGSRIKVWNLRTGRVARVYPGHAGGVNTISFSRGGSRIASGGNKEIKIWSLRSRLPGRIIKAAHSGKVTIVTFSPDGKLLASTGNDNIIKIWNWRTGKLLRSYNSNSTRVNALKFTPDSRYLISGGNDSLVRLWSTPANLH